MKVLVLGDGLLGSEIVKQTGWDYISRKKDNINLKNIESWFIQDFPEIDMQILKYKTVINCIAHTDSYSNDKE